MFPVCVKNVNIVDMKTVSIIIYDFIHGVALIVTDEII